MFCIFVPSKILLGSAFMVTLVKLVFDTFMLTLLVIVLKQMNLLSCLIVMLRALMKSLYPLRSKGDTTLITDKLARSFVSPRAHIVYAPLGSSLQPLYIHTCHTFSPHDHVVYV